MNPQLEEFREICPLTDPSDRRIGHLLGRALADQPPRVVIVGFPCDEGVRRNGGRIGASLAPDAIRKHFYRLALDQETGQGFESLVENTLDLGNVRISGDLEAAQENLGRCIAGYLYEDVVLVVLGGGHETSYGHFLGYVEAGIPVEILNWDAHADVRPLKDGLGHSGSPFRQVLLHPSGLCQSYRVVGLQRHSNTSTHLAFVREHGGAVLFREELSEKQIPQLLDSGRSALLISLDMDVVDQNYAPGVSAPAVGGLAQDLILDLAVSAGRSPNVRSFDLVEVNPGVDESERTSRLAAVILWKFLSGFLQRPEK
ncbi:MAG TPA: formimidoylglutamase [Acidobacteriota bacterium]|nr:formimidoylglutamase [Acidobacteriota bacterium]